MSLDGPTNHSTVPRSKIWAFATGGCALIAAYSLLNVIAGADLGYDAYPGGKEIVQRWAVGFLVFVLLTLGCAVATWVARRRVRSGTSGGAPQ